MSTRTDFQTIKLLSASKTGGQNDGIYLVKSKRSGTLYIEKHVKKRDLEMGFAQRELLAMIQCQNQPNIVQIRAHIFHDARVTGYGSIFMQHCELGCLSGLISQYASRKELLPDEGFLWKVLWDASIAFCHLYTGRSAYTIRKCAKEQVSVETKQGWNRIIHRDIKPANFFITAKNGGDSHCHYPTIVLGDFGFCTSFADINAGVASGHMNSGATPSFKVPEDPQFCARSDVYQLGLTLHCLARMRQTPVQGHPFDGDHPLPRQYRNNDLRGILVHCLRSDPDNRPLPKDLPKLVWKSYLAWRKSRNDDGGKLAKWAFHQAEAW